MASVEDVRGRVRIENLDKRFRLNIRDEVGMATILENALVFTGEDPVEARLLLNKVLLRRYGNCIGESLFVCDQGSELMSEKEVTMEMARILAVSDSIWPQEVAVRSARLMMTRPYDLDLISAMMRSLGGETAIRYFREEIAAKNHMTFPEGVDSAELEVYKQMEGLSFWEMDRDLVIMSLFRCHSAWRRGMMAYDASPENIREQLGGVLVDVRVRLRQLAKVTLGRRMITKGKAIEARRSKEVIAYDQVCHLLD